MPGGDGSGPRGMGPMTGRGAGYCAGYSAAGFSNALPGRGFGLGRGMGQGRGMGRGMGFGFRGGYGGQWAMPAYGNQIPNAAPYGAAPTQQQEIESLQGQAQYFENALAEIKRRIAELEMEAPNE